MSFWADTWLTDQPLQATCNHQLQEDELKLTVRDLWIDGRVWSWPIIGDKLPHSNLLKLAALSLIDTGDAGDKIEWLTEGRKFTVSSAYNLAYSNQKTTLQWRGWRLIWKLQVQQRVKTFVWTLAHDKILTNHSRSKRKMSDTSACFKCCNAVEDALHTLKDCPNSHEVWMKPSLLLLIPNFFTL